MQRLSRLFASPLVSYALTKQPNLTAIIQSRRLSMFGHIARMDDDADAKMILTAPPPDNWKRPPGRPCITWLNTIQRDLRVYNLTLNEAVDLAQNCPLWRLMSTYGLCTPSGACQKRRRMLMKQEMMRWQWHQLDDMHIICTLLQTDNHVSALTLLLRDCQ